MAGGSLYYPRCEDFGTIWHAKPKALKFMSQPDQPKALIPDLGPNVGNNSAQIEFWNGKAALGWVEHQEHMDRLLSPLSFQVLAKAGVRGGESVLDVGCGCGATAIEMARLGAKVIGVDISAPMLTSAQQRAAALGLQIGFHLADASTQQFSEQFDLLFSRFGVMFFADPVAAFSNLRKALKPSGRLAFICWQAARENVWMSLPAAALAPFVTPPPPVDPKAPGPFAFADVGYLRDILQQSGFDAVLIEPVESTLELGRTLDEAMLFTQNVGPLSRPLAEMNESTRARAIAAVRTALAAHVQDGAVRLSARCWIATAHAS